MARWERGIFAALPSKSGARRREIPGHNLNVNFTPPERPGLSHCRKLLWLVFWLVFLATPVLVVAVPPIIRHLSGFRLPGALEICLYLCSLMTGATLSGFLLARLMNADTAGFIRQGIGYSFVFTLLHLMIVIVLMTFLV